MRVLALIACAWVLGAAAPSEAPDPKAQTAHHTQAAKGQQKGSVAATVPVPAVNAKQSGEYKRPCGKPQSREDSELCAQWNAADAARDSIKWARIQTGLGVLGFFGLIATLAYTARGTNAAVDAVEAQVNSDRPLILVAGIRSSPNAAEPLTLNIGWWTANYGATGAWTEAVCLAIEVEPLALRKLDTEARATMPIIAFAPAGKGVGNGESHLRFVFSEAEMAELKKSRRLYAFGWVRYRDTGKRVWTSGFAGWVELADDLSGKGFNFYPSDAYWFDEVALPHTRKLFSGRMKRT